MMALVVYATGKIPSKFASHRFAIIVGHTYNVYSHRECPQYFSDNDVYGLLAIVLLGTTVCSWLMQWHHWLVHPSTWTYKVNRLNSCKRA